MEMVRAHSCDCGATSDVQTKMEGGGGGVWTGAIVAIVLYCCASDRGAIFGQGK